MGWAGGVVRHEKYSDDNVRGCAAMLRGAAQARVLVFRGFAGDLGALRLFFF